MMHKAFWDVLKEELNQNPPEYSRALVLLEEIKDVNNIFHIPALVYKNNSYFHPFFLVVIIALTASSDQNTNRNKRETRHWTYPTASWTRDSRYACNYLDFFRCMVSDFMLTFYFYLELFAVHYWSHGASLRPGTRWQDSGTYWYDWYSRVVQRNLWGRIFLSIDWINIRSYHFMLNADSGTYETRHGQFHHSSNPSSYCSQCSRIWTQQVWGIFEDYSR